MAFLSLRMPSACSRLQRPDPFPPTELLDRRSQAAILAWIPFGLLDFGVCEQTLLFCGPSPCDPAENTAPQPLIWLSESLSQPLTLYYYHYYYYYYYNYHHYHYYHHYYYYHYWCSESLALQGFSSPEECFFTDTRITSRK